MTTRFCTGPGPTRVPAFEAIGTAELNLALDGACLRLLFLRSAVRVLRPGLREYRAAGPA